jgi:hypothetical protein
VFTADMDVDCDGIDYQCKVAINLPCGLLISSNIEYRAIRMGKTKRISVPLPHMKCRSLSSPTNSLLTILMNLPETTLLRSSGE